jgi:hypothetical protein
MPGTYQFSPRILCTVVNLETPERAVPIFARLSIQANHVEAWHNMSLVPPAQATC